MNRISKAATTAQKETVEEAGTILEATTSNSGTGDPIAAISNGTVSTIEATSEEEASKTATGIEAEISTTQEEDQVHPDSKEDEGPGTSPTTEGPEGTPTETNGSNGTRTSADENPRRAIQRTPSQIALDAYSCTNVTYVTCGSYFLGIRTSAHNTEPAYNAISEDACWKFAEDANLTQATADRRAEHDIWTTGRMPSTPDGFIGDACAESWNVVAQRGGVDSKNGIHIESDLMDPNNCTISDHKCISNGRMIVWKVPDMHVFCSHELAGEFDALRLDVTRTSAARSKRLRAQTTFGRNDAFIKFLDTLPANITSPWMTHNVTVSQRSRRSAEAQLRTGFGGTERRPRELNFPSTTEAKTLTPTQQLEAVKLKFQALRAVLGFPPAQAFYNINVNRLAYDLKQRRLERQRKQTKWRDAEKAKTVSRSPTSRTGTFEEQQAFLRAVNNHNVKPSDVQPKTALQHKQTSITKTVTTTQTYLPTEASLTTKATSITQQPPTTTPTISATMTPETPRFPYSEPKIFLAKKATNGSIYFQGTNRKKYWDLKQMPHGSAVLEKETDVVHHVFWPSTEAEGIRLYRLSSDTNLKHFYWTRSA
ncbi:Integrase core domain containing protein [Aphelenchoides avenae]|nr:Integrase core domain containing protein [Aphelenchus avenae]